MTDILALAMIGLQVADVLTTRAFLRLGVSEAIDRGCG